MRAKKNRLGIERLIMKDAIETLREGISTIKEKDIENLLEKMLERRQWGYQKPGINFNLVTIKPRKGTNLQGQCTSDFAWNINFSNNKEREKAESLLKEIGLGFNRDGKEMKTSQPRLNIWKKDYSPLNDRQFSVLSQLIENSTKSKRKI